jgi:hypothetical protein
MREISGGNATHMNTADAVVSSSVIGSNRVIHVL